MRNFDERMDEIRNRSKARITKRKKVIASASSAFVVCITLIGILSTPNSVQTAVHATEVTNALHIYTGTTTVFYDTGDILAIAEGGDEILQYIDTLEEGHAYIHNTTETKAAALEAPPQKVTYRFEITDHLGTLRTFTLCGGELTDEDSRIVYILDSNQREYLLRLLGIVKE